MIDDVCVIQECGSTVIVEKIAICQQQTAVGGTDASVGIAVLQPGR
jgi:hypothetical protein